MDKGNSYSPGVKVWCVATKPKEAAHHVRLHASPALFVDKIVEQMERFSVVDNCYQTWWEFQYQIEGFYSKKERQRPPLSE